MTIQLGSIHSVTQLAVLLTRADEQDRADQRNVEEVADQAATQEANERVAQLQQKADDTLSEGWASGIGDIAGGAATAAAGFYSGDGASARDPNDVKIASSLTGAGHMAPGIGTIVSGGFKAQENRDDADAAKLDAQSQADIRRYNEAHENVQAANDAIKKVEQSLDQILQTQNAAHLAASRA
jgi:hypothetical protein